MRKKYSKKQKNNKLVIWALPLARAIRLYTCRP